MQLVQVQVPLALPLALPFQRQSFNSPSERHGSGSGSL